MPAAVSRKSGKPKAAAKPRRRPPSCTVEEKQAVDRFLSPLLNGAEESVVKYRAAFKQNPSSLVKGTLAYWQSVVKALRWAKATNLQRRT